jgi:hypothetical protein
VPRVNAKPNHRLSDCRRKMKPEFERAPILSLESLSAPTILQVFFPLPFPFTSYSLLFDSLSQHIRRHAAMDDLLIKSFALVYAMSSTVHSTYHHTVTTVLSMQHKVWIYTPILDRDAWVGLKDGHWAMK